MKKKEMLILLALVLVVVNVIFFTYFYEDRDETVDISSSLPTIEPAVEEALAIGDSTHVIVFVNESLNQSMMNEIKLNILSSLTESEFRLRTNLRDTEWFSGELTREGLEKLRLDGDVIKIEKAKGGGLADGIVNNIMLSIDKEYNLAGLNSITYDGEDLWGLAGHPSYSGVEYKKRIIKIDKNTGEIKDECSISFTGGGIEFVNGSLFVTNQLEYNNPISLVYEINPDMCGEKPECNTENGCIIDEWNITAHQPWGLTYDGEYFYIIIKNQLSNCKVSRYSISGELIGESIPENLISASDIVWDGNYFWTINNVHHAGIPGLPSLPPNYYSIRAYDKNWEEVFHQKFYVDTPVWYGITYDGENLWVSDGYNDKVLKILILNRDEETVNENDEGEEGLEPLSVEIITPSNDAIISNSSVKLEVTTNRNTTCEYSTEFTHPNLEGSTTARQMNVTGGTAHSHIVDDLKAEGHYTLTVDCEGESDYVWFDAKIPYEYKSMSGFINDSIGAIIRDPDSPNLVEDRRIYTGEEIYVPYVQSLRLYNGRIENSTSGGDLASPEVLIELDDEDYIYTYTLLFSKAINMSTMHNSDEYFEVLGEFYRVQEGSNSTRFVLRKYGSNDDIVFENNKPIMINGVVIDNSSIVELDGADQWGIVSKIIINVGVRESDKDYIRVGEYYDHWFFENLRLSFEAYHEDVGAEIRLGTRRLD